MFGWLKRFLGRRPVEAISASGMGALPSEDAWEGVDESHERFPFTGAYEFDYVDGKGQWSHRRMEAGQILLLDDRVYIHGRCMARGANRTFHAARMTNLVNAQTGEVVADPAAGFLTAWRSTPIGAAVGVAREHDHALVVLLTVARSTGRLAPKANAVIAAWLASLVRGVVPDDRKLRQHVRERPEPGQSDWRAALKVLATARDDYRVSLVEAIVALPRPKASNGVRDALVADAVAALRRSDEPRSVVVNGGAN